MSFHATNGVTRESMRHDPSYGMLKRSGKTRVLHWEMEQQLKQVTRCCSFALRRCNLPEWPKQRQIFRPTDRHADGSSAA